MLVLPELPKKRSFSQQLLQGTENAIRQGIPAVTGHLIGQKQQQQEGQALSRLTGQNLQGLSPEMKKVVLQNSLTSQSKANAGAQAMQGAAQALDAMESLKGKTGVGVGGSISNVFFGDARKNRGQFESLQAAVLPLFKSMFPRGMTEKEFKFIQEHYIPQLDDSEDKLQGKIDGLRMLINQQGGGQLSQSDLPAISNNDNSIFKARISFGNKKPQTIMVTDGSKKYEIPADKLEAFRQKYPNLKAIQ